MNRYYPLVLLAAIGVLILTCSRKSTNPPDDNNPPADTSFAISYVADPQFAAQLHISAQSGGTITASSSDGIQIQLVIPPHALASDTTVRVTPFTLVIISGPGTVACRGCDDYGNLCCFRGALFEPAGLVLDSPAALTITFPHSAPLPFGARPIIAYVDSVSSRYEPQFTEIDTMARTLTARITHFSGYGTDNAGHDRLEAAIHNAVNNLTARLGQNSFYAFLDDVKKLHDLVRLPIVYMGETIVYPDLTALIEGLVLDAYSRHASAVVAQANAGELCDGLASLHFCIRNLADFVDPREVINAGWSNRTSFAAIKTSCETEFATLFRRTAEAGKNKCDHDSCAAGRDLLYCALGQLQPTDTFGISRGFIDTVGNWALNCCRLKIELDADRSVINNLAFFPDDSNTIARLTATCSDASGPWIGAHVRFQVTHAATGETLELPIGNNQCRSTTDADGVATCGLEYLPPMSGAPSLTPGTWQAQAAFQYQPEGSDSLIWIKSNVVSVELRPVVFSLVYNYTFTYSTSGGCGGTNISGSAIGEDEDSVGYGPDCVERDKLDRTYTYSYSCTTPQGWHESRMESIIEPISIPPCFWGSFWKELTNSRGEIVEVLDYISVNYWSPGYINKQVDLSNNDRDTSFTAEGQMGNGIWPDFGTGSVVRFYCVNGTFTPVTFDSTASYTGGPITGSASTHLSIIVTVDK